jgi:Circadian oscillating protein COP23
MKILTSASGSIGLILIVGSSIVVPKMVVAAPTQSLPKTTFACIKVDGNPATIAIRGERTTSPMIVWKDTSYGKYTPQKRCQIVSQRLTKAVATSGKLSNLNMTYGMLNSLPVICFITRKGEKCGSENLLFSLKTSERGKEQEILDSLLDFSKIGKGNPTMRGGVKPKTLGDAIEQELTNNNDQGQE